MTSSRLAARVFALAGFVGSAALAAPVPSPEIAEAQLREINHRFVDAFVADDADFMDALIDEDFLYTGRDGTRLSRAELLARMQKPKPLDGATNEDVRVRLFGPVAVVHAVFKVVLEDGMPVQIRYTDVYSWNGTTWRLVSAQHTSIKDGVAVQQRIGTAPARAPWQGQDPTGDDLNVLRTLNENYVQAFRAADVAWYDAHLAPDYVVVYGDGSFHDRAAALADFAQPYFATHLKSFPVDDVSIRRYGDLALISAENVYELKDGRRGANRYTDLWLKQDGKWRCIAAHITVHKAPTSPSVQSPLPGMNSSKSPG
jgi:hypothetical protein